MLKKLLSSVCVLALSQIVPSPSLKAQQNPIKNVVLVHGAWVDGSGWKPVYDILTKDGYRVYVVQEPLTSFQGDLDAIQRTLSQLPGSCILVGHSYGGSLISQAGNDSHVAGLVYVAAHMPDAGESEAQAGKRFPSDLAKSTFVRSTPDRFNYLDPSAFAPFFAADLPAGQANFEANSQILTAISNFSGIVTKPAWRGKQSWMIVAGADRIINPDLERWYAKRANSHVTELAGASHSVYESRPREVAAVIEQAARSVSK